jgi:hypothetical protein
MKTKKITAADGTVYELPQSNIDIATIQAMIDTAIRAEREREHPVGSLWIREADIDPAAYFGFGTWQRVEGKMIMGASAQYPAGSTGGSATHTNTIDELVPHKHTIGGFPNGSPATWENPYGRIVYQTTSNNPYPAIAALINETGGGQPFSILNPYKAFYIWQRTA